MKSEKFLTASFVLQHDQSDCGVACLASVIRFHKGSISLDEIRQKSGTTKTGTTLLGLHQAASELGFISKGLQADGVENLKELNNPAILHIVIENSFQHYIVFYGFTGDDLIIGDPGVGVEIWSKDKLEKRWKSKTLLTLEKGAGFVRKESSKDKYATIKKWIFEDLNILVSALFLGTLIAIFNLSTAIFSQKLIDVILPGKDIKLLAVGLILFALVLLIRTGLSYIRSQFLITQSKDFNIRIVSFFIKSLLSLPKSFFDSKKTGEMIARMNDTRRIQTTVSTLVGNVMIEILVIVTSLITIGIYDWRISIIIMVFIPFFILLVWRFNKPIISHQTRVMQSYAINESNFIDVISGSVEIKSTGSEPLFSSASSSLYRYYQDNIYKLGKIQINYGSFADFLNIILLISVMGLASYFYLNGTMDLGVLVAIIGLSGTFGPSIIRVSVFNIQVKEARIAFERMEEFTGIEHEKNIGTDVDSSPKKISIIELNFNYPGSLDLLHGISFQIPKGRISVLFGESGEGKSTLIQLIQKFYNPGSGEILLDNKNIDALNTMSYRSCLGIVPQDIKIFNSSLLFNLVLSDNPKDYESVIKWCKEYGFSEYLEKFPQGFNTLLGEEGANISGGQKQLVGLIRALYPNPDFLLMDEATSAMDRKTEKFIFEHLQKIKVNTGILMVTHRLNLALEADYVSVLENGTIKDHGSSREIIDRDNLLGLTYRDMLNSKAFT